MPSERDKQQLLLLIEKLQRDGSDEAEITRAVEDARSESHDAERRRLS